MTEMGSLIERARSATGPDRELDADIYLGLLGGEVQWRQANYTMEMYPVARRPSANHVGGYEHEQVPLYTASIDAVLALVERCLPGWWVHGLGKSPLHGLWWCTLYSLDAKKAVEVEEFDTPPLAILSALLQALGETP